MMLVMLMIDGFAEMHPGERCEAVCRPQSLLHAAGICTEIRTETSRSESDCMHEPTKEYQYCGSVCTNLQRRGSPGIPRTSSKKSASVASRAGAGTRVPGSPVSLDRESYDHQ
eukprot:492778-Rhodomonas_salina.2